MKKITMYGFLVLGLVGLLACSDSESGVLEAGTTEESSEATATKLPSSAEIAEQLGLSAEQAAELNTAFEQLHVAMAAQHAGDAESRLVSSTFPMLEFIEASHGILRTEQFDGLLGIFVKHHHQIAKATQHRAKFAHGGHGRKPGPVDEAAMHAHMEARHARLMEVFGTVLELSDDQKLALEELLEQRQSGREEMHASGERPDKERMQAHHEQMQAGFAEILDEAQMARLETLHPVAMGMRRSRH